MSTEHSGVKAIINDSAAVHGGRLARTSSQVGNDDYCVTVVSGDRTLGIYAFKTQANADSFGGNVIMALGNKQLVSNFNGRELRKDKQGLCPGIGVTYWDQGQCPFNSR
jgi:hypothetical protein